MGTISWALTNGVPSLDSAAEAIILQRMWQTVWMGPLSSGWLVGWLVGIQGRSSGHLLRNRLPPTQLHALMRYLMVVRLAVGVLNFSSLSNLSPRTVRREQCVSTFWGRMLEQMHP